MARRATEEVCDPRKAGRVPITVVDDLPSFARQAQKVFDGEELKDVIDHVALYRELGVVIKGSGGLRKIRWATDNNKGKSNGARIMYWYLDDDYPLYLIAVYPKNKKASLSEAELKAARKFIAVLKRTLQAQRRQRIIRAVD